MNEPVLKAPYRVKCEVDPVNRRVRLSIENIINTGTGEEISEATLPIAAIKREQIEQIGTVLEFEASSLPYFEGHTYDQTHLLFVAIYDGSDNQGYYLETGNVSDSGSIEWTNEPLNDLVEIQ